MGVEIWGLLLDLEALCGSCDIGTSPKNYIRSVIWGSLLAMLEAQK